MMEIDTLFSIPYIPHCKDHKHSFFLGTIIFVHLEEGIPMMPLEGSAAIAQMSLLQTTQPLKGSKGMEMNEVLLWVCQRYKPSYDT